ncbi:MAG: PQQ-binding-like beta-propeller repeat protein [Armatimonadetes bacterium]|nr:PQQ-binding-like beta-propeller repeat protein [Armatimonadota bacterium]
MILIALLALGQVSLKATPVPKTTPTPRPTVTTAPKSIVAPQEPAPWEPSLLWRTSIKRGEGTAAIGKDGAFVTGATMVHRFNKEGRTDWSTEIGATQSELALDAKRVYVGSERGTVYALDRQSGAVAWKTTLGGSVRMSPAVIGQQVIFESSDNGVYGVDRVTGAQKWRFVRPDGALGYSAPVAGPEGSVFICGESVVYRLNAETGQELWRSSVGGKALGTVSYANGRVYVAGDGAGVIALDAETGERRWRFKVENDKTGPDWFGSPLIVGSTLYVSTYRRNVYALETTTGKVRWSTKVLGPALSRPALDEKRGVLYLSSGTYRDNPTLTALNAKTGAQVWDYKLGYTAAAPTLSGGRLYLASTNGYFYAFSIQ